MDLLSLIETAKRLTEYKAWANESTFSAVKALPEGEATKERLTRFKNMVHPSFVTLERVKINLCLTCYSILYRRSAKNIHNSYEIEEAAFHSRNRKHSQPRLN